MTARPRPTSARGLLVALGALLLLAALSLGFRFAHLGAVGYPVALGIAAVKATIVVIVFMEIGGERPTVRLAWCAGVALVALMVGLVLVDVATRAAPPLPNPPGTESRARG